MPQTLRILVVDDNKAAADALRRVLSKRGDHVEACNDGESAIEHIEASPPDVVLTDLKMEPVDGFAVLEAARAQRPPVEVMVFTAYGAVDIAVRAMRHGARDFLTKPVTADQIMARLDEIRADAPAGPARVAVPPARAVHDATPFVAESRAARSLLKKLARAARVPSPVWLEGEIGSGRGHAALELHRRSNKPGELVLHRPGQDHAWPTEGTVLLANVDNLPLDYQKELVRELGKLPSDVRVVATAGLGGRRLVAEGRLTPELYYALAVVTIVVPPLRERVADIAPLAREGLRRYAERYELDCPELTDAELARLERHSWPGNVRELLNLAERAVVMGADAFDLDVVEPAAAGLPRLEEGFSLSAYLESTEREILQEALRIAEGDRSEAGRLLGLERNTLRYKLNKYDLLER